MEASGALRGWGQGPPQASGGQVVGKCCSRRVRGGQASFNVISPPRPASQEGKCDFRVTQHPTISTPSIFGIQGIFSRKKNPDIGGYVTQAQFSVQQNRTLEARDI